MNTPSIKALPNGMRRITVHSDGERDLSADVTADELMVMVDTASNDEARGVHAEPAAPAKPKPAARRRSK